MRTFSTIDCQSLPHKMARMLKAELNTNLLLLNNQQLSALYFMKQRPPPPTIPRTPSCPYVTRVSVVSSGGVSPPTASLHILLPLIRMLSCPAFSLRLTATNPACSQSHPCPQCPHSFLLFCKLPRRFSLSLQLLAMQQCCVRPGDWSSSEEEGWWSPAPC